MGEMECTEQIGLLEPQQVDLTQKLGQREYLEGIEHKTRRKIRTGRTKAKHKNGGTNRTYGTATKIWNRWK